MKFNLSENQICRCKAMVRFGRRCANKVLFNGLCGTHLNNTKRDIIITGEKLK